MNKENFHRHDGYHQGFSDGTMAGGGIDKEYVKNLLKTETQHLSKEESLSYKIGWQDGYTDGVNRVIMFLKENFLKNKYVLERKLFEKSKGWTRRLELSSEIRTSR